MQIVIDISDEARERVFDILNDGSDFPLGFQCVLLNAIAEGIVLPENCDLVNRNDIEVVDDNITTVADHIRTMSVDTLAIYLHSWQVEHMSVEEIKDFLCNDVDNYTDGQ